MATTIKLKNSVTTTNAPSSLVQGEVAINITDKKVWVGNAATTPVQLLGDGASLNFTSLTLSANLNFTGTGNRITGDMSNATVANRVAFQNSVTNNPTSITVIPNGTSNTSNLNLENSSTPLNNSLMQVSIDSTLAYVISGIRGTGTYLPLVMYTGGSERLRIDTSGNVLIGTTSAATSSTLNVVSTGYQPVFVNTTNAGGGGAAFSRSGTQAIYVGTAGSSWLTGSSTADGLIRSEANMLFAVGNTERMRINANGNIGVGLTPYAWATIAPAIDFGSTGGIASFTNQAVFAYNLYYNGSNFVYKTSAQGAAYRLTNGSHYWETAPSGTAGATVVPSLRMVLNTSGNLSLNTGSTAGMLTVDSTTQIGIYSSTAGAYQAGYFITAGGNQGVYAQSSGNYGVYARTTDAGYGGLLAYDYNQTYYAILAYGGYSMYTNGSIYVNGTTYTSDARLKENVQPISNALDKIKQLNPVSFDWKANSAKGIGNNNTPLPDYGMIAQEVEQILPDLVRETVVPPKPKGDNATLSLEDELGSCKGVDYSRLIPFLTKAIQEQQSMIEELKAKVTALENK